jgi:hypothetical protein
MSTKRLIYTKCINLEWHDRQRDDPRNSTNLANLHAFSRARGGDLHGNNRMVRATSTRMINDDDDETLSVLTVCCNSVPERNGLFVSVVWVMWQREPQARNKTCDIKIYETRLRKVNETRARKSEQHDYPVSMTPRRKFRLQRHKFTACRFPRRHRARSEV